jgi:putative peptidoglycan lipid II flippase
LVDQAVAARLTSGSVAALAYGAKVIALITTLGAGALGTALLPYFAKMVAVANWDEVRHTTRIYSGLTLLVGIPLVAVLIFFSGQIIALVFQRGAFTASDTALVAEVQALYALQIPFFVLGILYARLLSSLGANRVLLWSTAITFPVNVALDIILSRFLGVAGIALATSLMYVAGCTFLAFMLRRVLAAAEGADTPGGIAHFRAEQIT